MLKFGTDLPLVTPQFGIANGPDRPIGGRDGGPLGEIFDVFEVFSLKLPSLSMVLSEIWHEGPSYDPLDLLQV